MKKLLFSAVNLDVGGIETALVSLLNWLASLEKDNKLQEQEKKYKYEITLVLEQIQGVFLNDLNKNIKIIQYSPSKNKIVLIRKLCNMFKQLNFKRKYGQKFDFSCSYATYSNPASFVARTASENSALWCHMDYLEMFGNKQKAEKFFLQKHYKEFKHIICISEESKASFLKLFPQEESKVLYINNVIDYEKILAKSAKNPEILNDLKNDGITTFINIGRHEEKQKKLSRIIEACKLLKEDEECKEKFRIFFVGDGPDTEEYKKMVNEYGLENQILFLGRTANPYPYLKMANCTILTSDYEGFPVTFVESMVLNKPIITTKVSGVKTVQEEGYAIITDKDTKSIYECMKGFIINGYKIENRFNPEEYNAKNLQKLEELF